MYIVRKFYVRMLRITYTFLSFHIRLYQDATVEQILVEVFGKSLCAKWNEWMRVNWNVMSVRYSTVFGRIYVPNIALFLLFVGCVLDNHKIHIVRIISSLNIYATVSSRITYTHGHRQRFHKNIEWKMK